jgi:hypothetical protein
VLAQQPAEAVIGVAPASFFASASTMIREIGFALDLPVEEKRFEPLVPGLQLVLDLVQAGAGAGVVEIAARVSEIPTLILSSLSLPRSDRRRDRYVARPVDGDRERRPTVPVRPESGQRRELLRVENDRDLDRPGG